MALVGLAWALRFVQDDAFISFRYAAHLAEGHGLVWNPGERVEGYTNFLWTLLIAGAIRLGGEPVLASAALGLLGFAMALLASRSLGRRLGGDGLAGLALLLLGTNYSMSAYATGGLETSLQTGLCMLALALLGRLREPQARDVALLSGLSLTAAAATLTRLDSGLIVGPVLVAAATLALRGSAARLPRLAALVLPFTLVVGAWLLWKVQYYGDVLPNTYHVKAAHPDAGAGWLYLRRFMLSYWLWPVPPLALLAWWRRRAAAPHREIVFLAALLLLWLAYVVRVGGDFMEFRFLVPILPLFFLGTAATIRALASAAWMRAALASCVIAGSAWHAARFRFDPRENIESIAELTRHVRRPVRGWIGLGQRLGAAFPRESGVRIAVTAAGAIPFYSRLPAVDMLGLNDRRVAREGAVLTSWAGHRRISTFRYLLERQVHLVIAHPYVTDQGPAEGHLLRLSDWTTFASAIPDPERLPARVPLIEIPIAPDRWLRALYLTPHPLIDRVIADEAWPVHWLPNPARPADGYAAAAPRAGS